MREDRSSKGSPAVIVTGAAGGVGHDAVQTLRDRGYHVYAGAIDPWEWDIVSALAAQPASAGELTPVMLDLRKHEQMAELAEKIAASGERLAGLVLNGAASPEGVPAEHTSVALLRDTYETNVIGNFAAIMACLPLLKRDRGRIIFISSATTFAPPPMVLPYVTAKCAMNGMSHVLRRELKNTGIGVSLLLPGVIKHTYMAQGLHEATKHRLAEIRGCTPEEVTHRSYERDQNTALMQPEGGADPFYEQMLQGQLTTIGVGLETGFMPSLVTKDIVKALEARRPKPVYVQGVASHAFRFISWLLSFRALDWVTRRMGYR
ncbi:SDR family NAD(P)-dependent oxidoreductase [Aurantiacibacter rhizosphaerae]|uniref:SDR family NAD(P)-dependent oxidoreductase n=1 Tax=Aurantiacibacter rhizosphaerae TaxID=2691582 RepID=A0A844XDT9_9SPHN|nr:SDR family NAD(P)-dependent oxidoreductase [Aurantiacibacter rhizosphaerae]